jgi:hypothetical protein
MGFRKWYRNLPLRKQIISNLLLVTVISVGALELFTKFVIEVWITPDSLKHYQEELEPSLFTQQISTTKVMAQRILSFEKNSKAITKGLGHQIGEIFSEKDGQMNSVTRRIPEDKLNFINEHCSSFTSINYKQKLNSYESVILESLKTRLGVNHDVNIHRLSIFF